MIYVVLLALAASMLFPFYWMTTTSFKDPADVFAVEPKVFPGRSVAERITDDSTVQRWFFEATGAHYPSLFTWRSRLNRLLFSVGLDEQAWLDDGKISLGLRDTFVKHGFLLATDAAVLVNQPSKRWIITDQDGRHLILNENNTLNIYVATGDEEGAGARLVLLDGFGRFVANNTFYALTITLGQVITSSLAAFAFARLKFPGRDKLFLAYLGTMMIPITVTMIPSYILMRELGWVDSYKAVILPSVFTAYGTFMLRQFFMTVPREIEDAARIDGCNEFGLYWRIMLPLSTPALATLVIIVFVGSWRSFMWPLIVCSSEDTFNLPLGLTMFRTIFGEPNWPLLMAGSVVMTLPMIVVFMLGQRYFVEGIRLGAVKG